MEILHHKNGPYLLGSFVSFEKLYAQVVLVDRTHDDIALDLTVNDLATLLHSAY
jgi:hypothetical protein